MNYIRDDFYLVHTFTDGNTEEYKILKIKYISKSGKYIDMWSPSFKVKTFYISRLLEHYPKSEYPEYYI